MKRIGWAAGTVLLAASLAGAQEQPGYDQLKKQYDDAVKQLEIANNRKNELASENERLKGQVADTEKRLNELKSHNDELEREAADWAGRTFDLRSHHAAWRAFVQHDPATLAEWEAYLQGHWPPVPGKPASPVPAPDTAVPASAPLPPATTQAASQSLE